MAAAKSTRTKPEVEYDFDSWDEESEQKALQAIAPKVKYIIVEGEFVGRFTDGTIVRMTLSLSVDDIDDVTSSSDNPIDQFKSLLVKLGDKKSAAEFTKRDLAEAMAMASKFFELIEKKAKASLGE